MAKLTGSLARASYLYKKYEIEKLMHCNFTISTRWSMQRCLTYFIQISDDPIGRNGITHLYHTCIAFTF